MFKTTSVSRPFLLPGRGPSLVSRAGLTTATSFGVSLDSGASVKTGWPQFAPARATHRPGRIPRSLADSWWFVGKGIPRDECHAAVLTALLKRMTDL
ncbi:hypothetical protein OOZ51_10275 [Arthrobacter sp. MI7-26]|uniref:hypothetical protein n=1 Tax=Arthrobacter sp. MI7-26 TaxID=2993653 RepID=UPI0022492BD7|nr:hypothetical protein [Arthrobacter sp. MI7-26]MCX2748196.1 hypothetical protein [Arthrobacter sp. MI7-26]